MSGDKSEGADSESPLNREQLRDKIRELRDSVLQLEASAAEMVQAARPEWKQSVRNLLHYLALRRHDIRAIQKSLVPCGLSSLGRCERFVLANLEAVLHQLTCCDSAGDEYQPSEDVPCDFETGGELLRASTRRLFGAQSTPGPRIMVTMSAEAATDPRLMRDLLNAGMNVIRINCAHDDPRSWQMMIENLRHASADLKCSCLIAMDLGGPKIRTGPIEPGPAVISWTPHRDDFGRVVSPARIWISPTPIQRTPVNCDCTVLCRGDWWQQLIPGDTLRFDDAAGRERTATVVEVTPDGFWCEGYKTTYLTADLIVRCYRAAPEGQQEQNVVVGQFGPIPHKEQKIVLSRGDLLQIRADHSPGRPSQWDAEEQLSSPAVIGCTLPEVFRDVQSGDRVLLDDGKFAGVVKAVTADDLLVEILRAGKGSERIRSDKGINFPDTDLHLPALTEKDILDLAFVAQYADMVNYSFARSPDDVRRLHSELNRLGKPDLPIVIKIETRNAFDNLALMLLEAMRWTPAVGVMIARGDLAVECGWERLVEVQEEILCICEAAHVPVIWATQVLEGLAKDGLPSRAEVTDAGLGVRAECVMLNKGPYIVETVKSLHDILSRMQGHQSKKHSTFRRLRVADHLVPDSRPDP